MYLVGHRLLAVKRIGAAKRDGHHKKSLGDNCRSKLRVKISKVSKDAPGLRVNMTHFKYSLKGAVTDSSTLLAREAAQREVFHAWQKKIGPTLSDGR